MQTRQSHLMSAIESATNVAVGFFVALLAQILVFPIFGIYVPMQDNILIGAIFTAVSLIRSYILRRLFEAIRVSR